MNDSMNIRTVRVALAEQLAGRYQSCQRCVAATANQQGKTWKQIADGMGMSPSYVGRQLSATNITSNQLTLDHLEAYIDVTGDPRAILYLVEKYERQLQSYARKQLRLQLADMGLDLSEDEKKEL